MGDLLQQVPLAPASSKRAPLLIEVPVHGDGAPFLISGTKGWVWVEGSRTGILRSAVRPGPIPEDIFVQVVREVARRGVVSHWGNARAFSEVGLKEAVAYIASYGIEEVEALVPVGSVFHAPKGVKLSESAWVPQDKAVVVPTDRTYLGMVGTFGTDFYTVVLHNPSRGMAVLGDW